MGEKKKIRLFFFMVLFCHCFSGFPGGSDGKNLPGSAGDPGSIPEKIPWRREWQPTPVFLLENSMDRGAWWAIVHGVAKRLTQPKQLNTCHTQWDSKETFF